jgi:hypothetical protein
VRSRRACEEKFRRRETAGEEQTSRNIRRPTRMCKRAIDSLESTRPLARVADHSATRPTPLIRSLYILVVLLPALGRESM